MNVLSLTASVTFSSYLILGLPFCLLASVLTGYDSFGILWSQFGILKIIIVLLWLLFLFNLYFFTIPLFTISEKVNMLIDMY